MDYSKLSEENLNKIKSHRMKDRPTWYDANTKTNKTISSDFEAFVIILDPKVKNYMNNWLSSSSDQMEFDITRTTFLASWLSNINDDSSNLYNAYNDKLNTYNKWRENWLTDNNFADVTEVGLAADDLSRLSDRLSFEQDDALHDRVVSSIWKSKYLSEGLTEDLLKEAYSWSSVVMTY